MKIGICTPYKIDNYGTKLQAYAVQEKIKSLGYDVEIINFDRKSDLRPCMLVKRYCSLSFLQLKAEQRKKRKLQQTDKNLQANLKIRRDAINGFDQSHYHTTPLLKGYSTLCRKSGEYSALVCGSDQIWLPASINNPTATLEFAAPNCRRIAFAPSFGIASIPEKKRKQYQKFLSELDFISVREKNGVAMIHDLIGKNVPVILDPTLSISPEIWTKIASEGSHSVREKYVFCYFLGKNEQHRIAVYNFARKYGLKIVTLPHFKGYNEADEKYTDIRLYDVTPCDFVRLISEAEVVCTDSFHATVFSILNHRQFYTFERFTSTDVQSTNSRTHSLLNQLGIQNHIVNTDDFVFTLDSEINYHQVDEKLVELRCSTDAYLAEAFSGIPPEKQESHGFVLPKNNLCTGCGACAAVCPKHCIHMQVNKNGFRMPVFDAQECVDCKLCVSVCPQNQHRNVTHAIHNPFFVQNKNPDERTISSSGGVFCAVAKKILNGGGYVCAAAYNKDFNVQHTLIHSMEELPSLIGSKYSESDLGDCFEQIEALLRAGKQVLFCGTPCQAHGLKRYLRKEYENLIVLDLLCYGIQSQRAWEKYLAEVVPAGKHIESINMRSKDQSWQKYSMQIQFTDGTVYLQPKEKDPYLRSYSKGLFIRPSCYHCQLKAFPRASDLTIGDFWDIDKLTPHENDGLGTSLVLVNSEAGGKILAELKEEKIMEAHPVDEKALKTVHPLFCLNAKQSRKSKKFFNMLDMPNVKFSHVVKACEKTKLELLARKIYRKIK